MKRVFFYLLSVVILLSCSMSGRIVQVGNPNNGYRSFKLNQNLEAYLFEQIESKHGKGYLIPLSTSYLYRETLPNGAFVSVNFQIKNSLISEVSDAEVYFVLDNENVRVARCNFTSLTGNKRSNFHSSMFNVPANLWPSIAGSNAINYRICLDKEEIDVTLNVMETKQLKTFIKQAEMRRNANFPLIPEGQKKW